MIDMSKEIHGLWEVLEVTKPKGKTLGTATVKMDSHTMAYLLKGINCRVDVYEKMMNSGKLADDDQAGFDFTKDLRFNVESARNETLEE
jgi:hypothetical protein